MAACPSCQAELSPSGTRLVCGQCKGSMVNESELHDMLVSMAADDVRPLDARLSPGGVDGSRACPACKAPMTQRLLGGVTIDRCGEHGVWFDAKELAAVLERNGDAFADREWVRNESPRMVGAALVAGPAGLADRLMVRGLWRWLTSPSKPKDR